MELKDKIAIVTGATSGIGRIAVLDLARRGMQLVLPVRNMEKGEKLKQEIVQQRADARVELFECRLDSMDSIRQFVDSFKEKYNKLHLLINNAGIWEFSRKETLDGIEMNFGVNHLAPFLMTNLLLDELKAGAPARVVTVSSMAHKQSKMRLHDIEGKTNWGSMHAYAQSKLANILFTKRLARELKESGVTANCLHPGVVNTRLFDKMPALLRRAFSLFMVSPEKGAETTIYLAAAEELSDISGAYFVKKKLARTSRQASDAHLADKLWDLSLAYTGLKPLE